MLYDLNVNCFIFLTIIAYTESIRRVVGGRDSKLGEFPYTASWGPTFGDVANYYKTYVHICTCAIVSPTWSITAAHCAVPVNKIRPLMVRYSYHYPSSLGNFSEVLEVIVHPANLNTEDEVFIFVAKHDICLLRTEPIYITQYVVLSPVDYKTIIGHEALVLGFGITNDTHELKPAIELGRPLQVLEGIFTQCLKEDPFLASSICISSKCHTAAVITRGDSGGPVMHRSGLIGVNSMCKIEADIKKTFKAFNRFSLALSSASVVAAISPALDWISQIISTDKKI